MNYKRYEMIVKRGRLYVKDTYYRGKDKNKFVLVADVKLLKKNILKIICPKSREFERLNLGDKRLRNTKILSNMFYFVGGICFVKYYWENDEKLN